MFAPNNNNMLMNQVYDDLDINPDDMSMWTISCCWRMILNAVQSQIFDEDINISSLKKMYPHIFDVLSLEKKNIV
jgi:hypothetical protein